MHVETPHLPLGKNEKMKNIERPLTIKRELWRIIQGVCGGVVMCHHETRLDSIITIYCNCDVSSYWMTLKKKRGYWKLKEEALDRILLRTRFGKGFGSVVRQTTPHPVPNRRERRYR
jgi:hypothetical protein